ncbi:uncharacterized protein ACJ7VT_009966 [Polymixia lowei]
MKPVWSLGVLLLGCAFGIPVPSLNDNRQQDQNIVNLLPKSNKLDNSTGNESLHQINDTLGNFTQDGSYPQMNDTQGNFTQLSNDTGRTTFMAILPMIKVTEELLQRWNGADRNSSSTCHQIYFYWFS